VEVKPQGCVDWALNAVDADFPVALGGVGVAGRKECVGSEDGEIKRSAGAEFANIHVAAEWAWRAGVELAFLGGRYAHYATERTKRDRGRSEGARDFVFELPVEEERRGEAFFEEATASDDAGPAPAFVRNFEDVDL